MSDPLSDHYNYKIEVNDSLTTKHTGLNQLISNNDIIGCVTHKCCLLVPRLDKSLNDDFQKL